MKRLRTIIFWLHLGTALVAGLVIALLALTGVALAFQPQILDWAESRSRSIAVPAPGTTRLGADQLVARFRAAVPGSGPATLTFHADRNTAVRVTAGRNGAQVNPYTGEVRPLSGQGWRDFFQLVVEWHRYLGTSGDGRNVGKAITGVANAGFFFLALSGLYLWWPRRWSERARRLSFWFQGGLRGKARDWNWHNVIGFWSLPVLIVVTFSGMMISYRPVTGLVYAVMGERVPAGTPPPPKVTPPPANTAPLGADALLAAALRQHPTWKTATLRPAGGDRAAAPVSVAVKESDQWPLFGSAQLSLDPFTGQVLRREAYGDFSSGRKLRTWLRFLHTGEALGWPGQLLAGLVSLGATLMVWTGFALAFRRFFPGRRAARAAATAAASGEAPAAVASSAPP